LKVKVYIGIGSNLDNPVQQVNESFAELDTIPGTALVLHSSLYRTAPMGPEGQDDYINAVAVLETRLDAHELLHRLQEIEQQHRRVRLQHWGPRTLDLDILLYGDKIIESDELVVPHPGIHERPFVLYPLVEVAPDLEIPGNGNVNALLALCQQAEAGKVIEKV
jgi:2-amino-4-hydroxy-6-hydroxymethyldihydropteridine diphosphokinase